LELERITQKSQKYQVEPFLSLNEQVHDIISLRLCPRETKSKSR